MEHLRNSWFLGFPGDFQISKEFLMDFCVKRTAKFSRFKSHCFENCRDGLCRTTRWAYLLYFAPGKQE